MLYAETKLTHCDVKETSNTTIEVYHANLDHPVIIETDCLFIRSRVLPVKSVKLLNGKVVLGSIKTVRVNKTDKVRLTTVIFGLEISED